MPTAATKQSTQTNYFPPQQGDLIQEFEQNNKSYQLFKAKGLNRDIIGRDANGNNVSTVNRILDDGLFRRVKQFLSNVDRSKGPIERRVTKLERRKDFDPNTRKIEEHLVVHVEWLAKDFLGNQLVSVEMLEGMRNQPLVQTVIDKGRHKQVYSNWQAVYDIPFSKEAVNEALENQTNIPELVKYMVRTSKSDRDDTYSLEQFRDTTFDECIEIHKQGKGLNR